MPTSNTTIGFANPRLSLEGQKRNGIDDGFVRKFSKPPGKVSPAIVSRVVRVVIVLHLFDPSLLVVFNNCTAQYEHESHFDQIFIVFDTDRKEAIM